MLKYFSTDKAKIDIEDGERAVIATISSATVDRDNEVVLPRGANLDNYQKNPVVLWAHESWTPPIGKNAWIKATPKGLVAKTIFAETERAEEIYQLFKGGFLNAFSVGFMSTKQRKPTAKEIEKNPEWADVNTVHAEWEMFEYSPVPIPSNTDALAIAVGKGLKISDELRAELKLVDIQETEPDNKPVDNEPVVEKEPEPPIIIVSRPVIPVTSIPTISVCRYMPVKRQGISVTQVAGGIVDSINKIKGVV